MKARIALLILLALYVSPLSVCKSEEATEKSTDSKYYQVSQDVIDGIDAAIATQKKEARDLIWQGITLFNANNFDQAIEKFSQAREIVDIPIINSYIGLSYYYTKKEIQAAEYFDRAIELHKKGPSEDTRFLVTTSYLYRILIATKAEDYEKASSVCDEGLIYASKSDKHSFEEAKAFIAKAKAK